MISSAHFFLLLACLLTYQSIRLEETAQRELSLQPTTGDQFPEMISSNPPQQPLSDLEVLENLRNQQPVQKGRQIFNKGPETQRTNLPNHTPDATKGIRNLHEETRRIAEPITQHITLPIPFDAFIDILSDASRPHSSVEQMDPQVDNREIANIVALFESVRTFAERDISGTPPASIKIALLMFALQFIQFISRSEEEKRDCASILYVCMNETPDSVREFIHDHQSEVDEVYACIVDMYNSIVETQESKDTESQSSSSSISGLTMSAFSTSSSLFFSNEEFDALSTPSLDYEKTNVNSNQNPSSTGLNQMVGFTMNLMDQHLNLAATSPNERLHEAFSQFSQELPAQTDDRISSMESQSEQPVHSERRVWVFEPSFIPKALAVSGIVTGIFALLLFFTVDGLFSLSVQLRVGLCFIVLFVVALFVLFTRGLYRFHSNPEPVTRAIAFACLLRQSQNLWKSVLNPFYRRLFPETTDMPSDANSHHDRLPPFQYSNRRLYPQIRDSMLYVKGPEDIDAIHEQQFLRSTHPSVIFSLPSNNLPNRTPALNDEKSDSD